MMRLLQVQVNARSHQRGGGGQRELTGSEKKSTAIKAPMNGAVEKYAEVRAAPRWRSARTNKHEADAIAEESPSPPQPRFPSTAASRRPCN
jgi:hypothetical protein